MKLGGILSIAILAPNLAWLAFRPRREEKIHEPSPTRLSRALGAIEIVARVGVFTAPSFYDFVVARPIEQTAAIALVEAILVYYACWARYFARGRRVIDLYAPLWKLPIPMAVAPVVAFFMGAIVLHSIPLGVAALLLGISHIPLSQMRAADLASRTAPRSPRRVG